MNLATHYEQLSVRAGSSILGIRLPPLSFGHAKLLPALGLSNPQSLSELIAAILICGVPAREAFVALSSRWWRLRAYVRGAWAGLLIRAASGRWKCGPHIILLAAAKQWADYVARCRQMPKTFALRKSEGTTLEYATPFLAHVEHVLTADCGLSPEQVDDMPLTEALWRYTVAKEAAGDVALLDGVDIDEDEYAAMQRQADENEARWIAQAREAVGC